MKPPRQYQRYQHQRPQTVTEADHCGSQIIKPHGGRERENEQPRRTTRKSKKTADPKPEFHMDMMADRKSDANKNHPDSRDQGDLSISEMSRFH